MRPVFMIVDPDPFVADDLSEIVRETVPRSQVIHSPDIDAHTMQIVNELTVYGVFLGGASDDSATRAFGARLSQRGVAVARIGVAGARWITSSVEGAGMDTAFTDEAVVAVLRSWLGDRPLSRMANGDDDEPRA